VFFYLTFLNVAAGALIFRRPAPARPRNPGRDIFRSSSLPPLAARMVCGRSDPMARKITVSGGLLCRKQCVLLVYFSLRKLKHCALTKNRTRCVALTRQREFTSRFSLEWQVNPCSYRTVILFEKEDRKVKLSLKQTKDTVI